MSPKSPSAQITATASAATPTNVPVTSASKPDIDLVYQFKISRKALPVEFRNLWELAIKGPKDTEWQVEIDADMLETVINRIGFIFEADGL